MKGLPLAHIAVKPGEIIAHGFHVDLITPTESGSHQVRVVQTRSVAFGVDPKTERIVGFFDEPDKVGIEAQHNFRKEFDDSFDVSDRNFFANREDRVMPNGMPDPRGTAMGGYNPR